MYANRVKKYHGHMRVDKFNSKQNQVSGKKRRAFQNIKVTNFKLAGTIPRLTGIQWDKLPKRYKTTMIA